MHINSGIFVIFLVGAAFFTFFGMPLLVMGSARRKDIEKLVTDGLVGSAEIISYGGNGKTRWVNFRFVPEGATEQSQFQKIVYGFRTLNAGEIVEVRYSERNPFISALVPLGDKQEVHSQITKGDLP